MQSRNLLITVFTLNNGTILLSVDVSSMAMIVIAVQDTIHPSFVPSFKSRDICLM